MLILKSLLGYPTVGPKADSKDTRGFTLVELLVVIAIISVLATLLLLQLGVARAKARDAKRIADINQIRSALELWFDDYGRYRDTTDMNAAAPVSLTPTYLINIPRDPLANAGNCPTSYDGTAFGAVNCYGYAYTPATNPARMMVWAELEQRNANALGNDTDINPTGWSGASSVNGNTENCSPNVASDCIYDSGQP